MWAWGERALSSGRTADLGLRVGLAAARQEQEFVACTPGWSHVLPRKLPKALKPPVAPTTKR